MKTWSIGVLGAGAISHDVHLPVLASMPNVSIAWVMDKNELRARSVAAAYRVPFAAADSANDEFQRCEVVLVAIPPGVRGPYYQTLSANGINVFAEKPLTVSYSEHDRVVGMFPSHALGCGFQRRTFASTLLLKRIVEREWFGPLRRIRISEGNRITTTRADSPHYDDFHAAGGGVLISQGCHALDSVLYVTGARRYRVLQRNIVFDGPIDRHVQGEVELTLANGNGDRCCELEFSFSWLMPQKNELEFEFDRVRICTGLVADSPVLLFDSEANGKPTTLSLPAGWATTVNQAAFLEWDAFLRGLEQKQPSIVSASSASATAALIDELYRGARERE